MYPLLVLIFISCAFGFQTCQQEHHAKCGSQVCSKVPTVYCMPNTIQNHTRCICDPVRTQKIRALDGSFTCTTHVFRCNSSDPEICCGRSNYFIDIPNNRCSPLYPNNVGNIVNNSFTCNTTVGETNPLVCGRVGDNQFNVTVSCANAFAMANPGSTSISNFPCCSSINEIRINGVCTCINSARQCPSGNLFLPGCSTASGCNIIFQPSNPAIDTQCACKSYQSITYQCGTYTCTDRCTPGSTLSIPSPGQYDCDCNVNLRCPPGSDGLDPTCSEKELRRTRCYTNGTDYINVFGENCNCNWTRLSDEACPVPCRTPAEYCEQMEGTPYPRCKQECHNKCHGCDECSKITNVPSGTFCRDVRLNGRCIAHLYHVCNGCEYPGPQIPCPTLNLE